MTAARNPVPRPGTTIADLRGLARLAVDAVEGGSRIVEGVHQSVWDTLGLPGAAPGQTGGITGFAYRGVRSVARFAGGTADRLLAPLAKRDASDHAEADQSPSRVAAVAALNGVMGDHLESTGNPLALTMSLRRSEHAPNALPRAQTDVSPGKVLLLVHGLCLSERNWRTREGGAVLDYGEELRRVFGHTPLYLRYNSGLHVSHNGRELSALLERIFESAAVPIDEISVLAHSMGGLVMRSAILAADAEGARWRKALRRVVFLGTPHHGAPLERSGSWLHSLLETNRWTRSFASLARLRSAGITDLRYGHVVDADGVGQDRFHREGDHRVPTPLPSGVDCFAVAATTMARKPHGRPTMGDGLVPLASALGQHRDARRALAFAPDAWRIVFATNHMQLLGSREVADQLLRWFDPLSPSRP